MNRRSLLGAAAAVAVAPPWSAGGFPGAPPPAVDMALGLAAARPTLAAILAEIDDAFAELIVQVCKLGWSCSLPVLEHAWERQLAEARREWEQR